MNSALSGSTASSGSNDENEGRSGIAGSRSPVGSPRSSSTSGVETGAVRAGGSSTMPMSAAMARSTDSSVWGWGPSSSSSSGSGRRAGTSCSARLTGASSTSDGPMWAITSPVGCTSGMSSGPTAFISRVALSRSRVSTSSRRVSRRERSTVKNGRSSDSRLTSSQTSPSTEISSVARTRFSTIQRCSSARERTVYTLLSWRSMSRSPVSLPIRRRGR